MSIQLENISCKMNKVPILKNINLEVHLGKLHVILGQNGAGKTTLFKTICGDIQPTEGSVTIDLVSLEKWKVRDLARRRAVLTQEYDLVFPFTVREVVGMGRFPYLDTRHQKEKRIQQSLKITSMSEFQDRMFATLSGGEKQRVQFSRVLAQIWDNPRNYLLLDEPISGLDIPNQVRVLEGTREMAERGYGVLIILHDLNLAFQYADTITILKKGKIIYSGEPLNISESLLTEAYDTEMKIIENGNEIFIVPKQKIRRK